MKRLLIGFAFGISLGTVLGLSFCGEEPEQQYCSFETNLSCSAAKVAAGKVCDCQIVCYEDR